MTSQQKTSQQSREKTRVTLGYTYYDNPDYLSRQLELWKTYPAGVDIFVVDDGSEIYPAVDILSTFLSAEGPSCAEIDTESGSAHTNSELTPAFII